MRRPADLFDREWEWETLTAFATDPSPGATLGVVSGRRRQGKSFLLQELCAASGGFYFAATEATEAESLRAFGRELAQQLRLAVPLALTSWEQALDAVLGLGVDTPIVVVLDEFPYLCKAAPSLPSTVQRALGPRRGERLGSRTRLVLCGSALSFMGRLLSGSAPLRGRSGLDLTVATFDPRLAADFWGITDWDLALRVHAVVGGTPAYRREFVRDDSPAGAGDFDAWVCRAVLNPASPLFKEARYLLAEEADLRDLALYHSVLAAVAAGRTVRGGIANYIGRRDDTLRHPLTVLEDAGFLTRSADPFRPARSSYRIAEPLLTFYHSVMRPEWSRLERPGRAAEVWRDAQERFRSQVLGPHFETICRWWTGQHADPATFGGQPARVSSGVVNDPAGRGKYEVDVVATDSSGRLLVLGEAKYGETTGVGHLERLRRIRGLLAGRESLRAAEARLACFSATGFTDELRRVEQNGEVVLVDLARIYTGH
ncbi:MAG: ATP-binding protein [Geodermatophilaceae bacterium]|nr:ATP-binding protein [Geodermatophilaceae bacterium]